MRPRHDRGWWQTTIATWLNSGLSAEQFAADHDIHPGTLRWWRRQLELEAAPLPTDLTLLRVEVAEAAASPAPLTAVVGPAELRFAVGTDVAYLGELVAAIARAVPRC